MKCVVQSPNHISFLFWGPPTGPFLHAYHEGICVIHASSIEAGLAAVLLHLRRSASICMGPYLTQQFREDPTYLLHEICRKQIPYLKSCYKIPDTPIFSSS